MHEAKQAAGGGGRGCYRHPPVAPSAATAPPPPATAPPPPAPPWRAAAVPVPTHRANHAQARQQGWWGGGCSAAVCAWARQQGRGGGGGCAAECERVAFSHGLPSCLPCALCLVGPPPHTRSQRLSRACLPLPSAGQLKRFSPPSHLPACSPLQGGAPPPPGSPLQRGYQALCACYDSLPEGVRLALTIIKVSAGHYVCSTG